MKIEFLEKEKALIMSIEGEIDHRYATQIRREADRKIVTFPDKSFVIDLRGVSFMDSSGIGVIIGRYKLVTSFGQKVIIISTNPTVDKILDMSGIKKIINVYTSPEEALSLT